MPDTKILCPRPACRAEVKATDEECPQCGFNLAGYRVFKSFNEAKAAEETEAAEEERKRKEAEAKKKKTSWLGPLTGR